MGTILVMIILIISYWLFLIFDYSTLLLVVFVGAILIALFKLLSFRKYKNHSFSSNDFVYIDPPYLLSTASYNENGGWSENDEIDLLNFLTDLDNRNIRFALSNVLVHKGKTNHLLKKWAKQYKIHYLNHNYNNSNYQSTASKQSTTEVLITNY